MVTDELILIGTDPKNHPGNAWRVLQQVTGPATGSLFLTTHPSSRHLWMDTPLNADAEHSQAVAVFRKGELEQGFQTLPVARWSGLSEGPRRVIQPAYSPDGREVWMVVWNPQDLGSAIVVVDDATLQPIATIRRPDLITPTRIFNVAALRAGAVPADAASQGEPALASGDSGAELYASNCATCHGTYGEGDGPMAPSLSTSLKDLRYLAQRNEGEFPADFVRAIIDGRAMRAAHGPEGMPVWGAVFSAAEGDGAEAGAEAMIDALVQFLRATQVKRGQ
jgi:cytochrome c553